MPPSIDPTTTFFSVAQTLLGRVLLFFAAGWFGTILGEVSAAFKHFRDLLDPLDSLGSVLDRGFLVEMLHFVFWPILALNTCAKSIPFFFIAVPTMAVLFYIFVYTDEPTPFWWLFLAGLTSIFPMMDNHVYKFYAGYSWHSPDFYFVPWLIFGIFWIGLGYGMWWAIQKYHGEWIDLVKEALKQR